MRNQNAFSKTLSHKCTDADALKLIVPDNSKRKLTFFLLALCLPQMSVNRNKTVQRLNCSIELIIQTVRMFDEV